MRRLLLALIGLVGVGAAYGQGSISGIPSVCIDRPGVSALLNYLMTGEKGGLREGEHGVYYECDAAGGPYWVLAGHVRAAQVELGGTYVDYTYGDGGYYEGCPVEGFGPLIRGGAPSYPASQVDPPYICWETWVDSNDKTYWRSRRRYWSGAAFTGGSTTNASVPAYKEPVDLSIDGHLGNVVLAYDLALASWYRTPFNNVLAGVLNLGRVMDDGRGYPGGEPDPTEPGGGDGGTDWQEGQHRTRCDGSGELNIFEKALFFAFEPCQPWADMFSAKAQEGQGKMPFGFAAWFPCYGEGCAGSNVAYLIRPNAVAGAAPGLYLDHEIEGFAVGTPGFRVPEVVLNEHVTIPEISYDLGDTAVFQWWMAHGRVWLWWFFVGAFYTALIRRLLQQ